MGADEEVGHDTVPVTPPYREAILPPQLSGQLSRFLSQGLVDDAQRVEGAPESSLLREVGAYLAPYNVAGHQSPCVVGLAERLS